MQVRRRGVEPGELRRFLRLGSFGNSSGQNAFECAHARRPQLGGVDLAAVQHDGKAPAILHAVVHFAGDRPPGDLGAGLGEGDGVLAHGEASLQRERAFVAHRFGQLFVLRRPIEETGKAGAVQREIAAESLPGGGIGDGAVERQLGAARQAGAQIAEQQHTLGARHFQLDAADGLAAEAGLIEIKVDLTVGVFRQRFHHRQDEVARGFERTAGAFLRLCHAIEVKPARGKAHLDVEGFRPRRRGRTGNELRLPDMLEGDRDVVEAKALRVSGDA